MAKLVRRRISKRTVEALTVERDTVFWDTELMGFGVRVYPGGKKSYIAQTRARGQRAKRVKVADYGVIPPSEARRRAAVIILRIRSGQEPDPWRIPEQPALEPVADPEPEAIVDSEVRRKKRKRPAPRPRLSREEVRAGAIRISESLANDVITGWAERKR